LQPVAADTALEDATLRPKPAVQACGAPVVVPAAGAVMAVHVNVLPVVPAVMGMMAVLPGQ